MEVHAPSRSPAGVVLTGGRSSRMGRDKALVAVAGVPMAQRVAGALADAGCHPVIAVGGDLDALAAAGLDARPDPRQGTGPLGGLLSALEVVAAPVVVVVACDLPWLGVEDVAALLGAARSGQAAIGWSDRLEPLCAAWPRPATLAAARALLDEGERAMHALAARVEHVLVPLEPAHLRNVNHPRDLEPQ